MALKNVLLLVDDGELRARYELMLRFCGFEPLAITSRSSAEGLPDDLTAACVLTDHSTAVERLCRHLLDAGIPVVRIDPFIRHAREHLPFDVVLPATGEPRQLIAALRHLVPDAPRPA